MPRHPLGIDHWNYRVLRVSVAAGDPVFEIHEVFYGDAAETNILGTTATPGIIPLGDTFKELRQDLLHMIAACDKPILDYDEIVAQETPAAEL